METNLQSIKNRVGPSWQHYLVTMSSMDENHSDYIYTNNNSVNSFQSVVMAVMYFMTSILVLVLNTFCLIVLHRTKKLKEPTKAFMMSLNAADLTSGAVIVIPAAVYLMLGWWPFGDIFCNIFLAYCYQAYCCHITLPFD